MKIGQFIDTDNIGGAETMLARLSISLSKQGHEVVVFHFGNEYLEEICKKHNIKNVIIPFHKLYKSIVTVVFFSLKFAQLLKQHNIDILHSHLYGPITGAFLGTFLFRIPHIGTLHDVYMVQERAGRGLLLRLAQFTKVKLISVSNDMRSFYQNYIPFCKTVNTIYNGYDREQEMLPTDDFLAQLKNDNDTIIVTVGRLIPLKRQIHQVSELSSILKGNNTKLLIVGNGPDYQSLKNLIQEKGLNDKVLLLGERNDVQSILDIADIFILASESEGLSCSIIEAMSAGLPCIVSNVGGNRELIINNKNGYLFQLYDQDQFREAVMRLINDADKRKKMGRESKEIVLHKFSMEIMTQNYIQAYFNVLNYTTRH